MGRIRITVRGENAELRGYMDADQDTLMAFAEAMKPYGLVVASLAEDDYNPFTEPAKHGNAEWGRRT